ncbi:DNA-binding domain-containing protein [Saccharospirillum alexandrii]|uniref:HvfC/BufC N-terminal domain-containing protein n=1 Tax=Saccharospirillum alexandrii TaxID=2448477 RepID=UPI000FDCB34F|nr:DNA-binding domain-containing protein [Saccharospirillum alexandrii]
MHDPYRGLGDFVLNGQADGLHQVFSGPQPEQVAILYRNGYLRACREALQARFPAVASVMGDVEFRKVCSAYVQASPPRQRTLTRYGVDFPDWLSTEDCTQANPGLVDLARLDGAWLDCLFGLDESPLTSLQLNQLIQSGGGFPVSLRLPRNARVVALGCSVFDVWMSIRQGEGGVALPTQPEPGHALFWRPDMTVFSRQLDAWEARFYLSFQATDSLDEAAEHFLPATANDRDGPITLEKYFARLIESGLLIVGD